MSKPSSKKTSDQKNDQKNDPKLDPKLDPKPDQKTVAFQKRKPRAKKIVKAKEPPKEENYAQTLRRRQKHMPLVDHVYELRNRLLRSLVWIVVFSVIAFIFYEYVWQFVLSPVQTLMESSADKNLTMKLITTRLMDYFMIKFKLVFFVGLIFAIPGLFYEIWAFIMPAMDRAKSKWGYVLLFLSILLFWTGALLARQIVWPMVIEFLVYEWMPPDLPGATMAMKPEVHLTLDDYLSFFFGFHFAFGLTFQLPIISLILSFFGILRSEMYIKHWRMAIIVIAALSAFITPPDVFSMLIMMAPMIILYFVSALLVKIAERKRKVS